MPPKKPAARGGGNVGGHSEPAKVEGNGQPTDTSPASVTSTPSGTPAPSATPRGGARPSPSTRGKPVIAPKPKFSGRRSAAARADAEAQEVKKKEAEAKAAAEEAKKNAKDARRFGYRGNDRGGRGGGRAGRGRGGHMGDASRFRQQEPVASGPFSSGQAAADAKRWGGTRVGAGGGAFGGGGGPGSSSRSSGGGGGGHSSGGMAIKSEHGGDVEMGGMGPIKTEDGGYISSDEDEAEAQVGPRRNIDQMQIIDLTKDTASEEDVFAPVRLARMPHKDRTVGLHAEDDSPDSSDVPEAISEKRKGKQKAKDVEFTGESHIPKRPTTYSSSETEEPEPLIKQEPTDDEQTRPGTPEPILGEPPTGRDPPSSPESKRKAKENIKAAVDAAEDDFEIPPPPRFQTQAEKDEWDRHYDDLRQVRQELGRLLPANVPLVAPVPAAEGETAPDEDQQRWNAIRETQQLRQDHVYLFQFPPVLPDLVPVTVKSDPETNGGGEAMDVDVGTEAPATEAPATEVKKDEMVPPPKQNIQPKLPSGQVGKLKIHKSGKATLNWGGTSMVLGKGADATFLQNVLIAQVPETKPKEGEKLPEDQESAIGMGMGLVRGKFVLTPNWEEILK